MGVQRIQRAHGLRLLGEPLWTGLARRNRYWSCRAERTSLRRRDSPATKALESARRSWPRLAHCASSLTDAEATAQSASERMSLPVVGLMLGFIVFLAWPAVLEVTHGL